MKKSQKSKIVLCSILGLAAISIGSVGFATWLVGINKKTETLTVEALVDNSVNDSQYIEISVANNTFHVAETATIDRNDTHIVGASEGGSGLGVQADALQFTINNFTVLIGNGVTSKPTKVVLELTASDNLFNTIDGTKDLIKSCKYTSESGSTTIGARSGESFTYLTYKEEFSLSDSNYFSNDEESTSNSYVTYTFNAQKKVRQMSWGSFYSYVPTGELTATTGSPATYYNALYTKYTTNPNSMSAKERFDFADKINQEITALNTTFTTNHTLTIKASLA